MGSSAFEGDVFFREGEGDGSFLLLVRCVLWEARDRDVLEDEGRGGKKSTCGVVLTPCTAISVPGMVLEADAEAIRRSTAGFKEMNKHQNMTIATSFDRCEKNLAW